MFRSAGIVWNYFDIYILNLIVRRVIENMTRKQLIITKHFHYKTSWKSILFHECLYMFINVQKIILDWKYYYVIFKISFTKTNIMIRFFEIVQNILTYYKRCFELFSKINYQYWWLNINKHKNTLILINIFKIIYHKY